MLRVLPVFALALVLVACDGESDPNATIDMTSQEDGVMDQTDTEPMRSVMCEADSDCPAGFVCFDSGGLVSYCELPCTTRSECPEGLYCVRNDFAGRDYCSTDSKTPCLRSADCEPGQACHPNGHFCFKGCRSESDCGEGMGCDVWAGWCMRSDCSSDSDCTEPGKVCKAGVCQNVACITEDHCGERQTCFQPNGGYTISGCRPHECASSLDCADGTSCREQICIPDSCFIDDDCGLRGLVCDRGTCISLPCETHEDCGEPGRFCFEGKCTLWECFDANDTSCGKFGLTCAEGVCQ